MRAAEFQCDPRAREPGSATKESDGRRPAALRKLLGRETTGGTTEAVGARDDRRYYGSCQRARRPAALRKLSPREATGGATEAVGTREDQRSFTQPKAFVNEPAASAFHATNSVCERASSQGLSRDQ